MQQQSISNILMRTLRDLYGNIPQNNLWYGAQPGYSALNYSDNVCSQYYSDVIESLQCTSVKIRYYIHSHGNHILLGICISSTIQF